MKPVMVEAAIQWQFKGSEGQHKRQHLTYATQSAVVMAASLLLILLPQPPVTFKANAVWYDLQLPAQTRGAGSHHMWPCAPASHGAAV